MASGAVVVVSFLAPESGLVHDRRRPPHLADSPATPSAEVGRFEAAPGEGPRSKPVQVLGSGIGYPVPAGLPSSVPVEAALGVVPKHVVHPVLLGGWWLRSPSP